MMPERNRAALRGRLRFDEPAARHTPWGIGGPIARFYEPVDSDDLLRFLQVLPRDEVVVWTGVGCNLLVRDGGYPGTVISPRRVYDQIELRDDTAVFAGAGVRLPKLVRFCSQQGLRGAAPFANWPHTLGGALHLSVARGGASLWPAVESVRRMNRYGEIEDLSIPALRERGMSHDEWLIGVQLRFAAQTPAREHASKPAAVPAHGPLFRPARGRTVHEVIRQAGLQGIGHDLVQLHEDDANYVHLRRDARVSDLERLTVQVQDTVRARLGVRLERQLQLIGQRP